MPVMGPSDNQENADRAYRDILQIVKEKYQVHYDLLTHPKMNQADMNLELQKLQEAVRGVFRLWSWDGW